jgi:hypothetical protein
MVIEAAVLVVNQHEQCLVPLARVTDERVINIQNEILPVPDVGGRMIVVGRNHAGAIDEERIDPTNAWQSTVGRLLEKIF